MSTGTWPRRALRSASSWRRFTTTSACTRRSASATGRVRTKPPQQGGRCAATFYMSFLRHAQSIGPMWCSFGCQLGARCRLPLVGPEHSHKGATEIAPLPIVRDESHRLCVGRLVSTSARLRFTGCIQHAMKEFCRSRNFQRTANCVLTVCLSLGGKRNYVWCLSTAAAYLQSIFRLMQLEF